MANGNTTLHDAIESGVFREIAREVIQNPHLINLKNNDGNTPLNLIFDTNIYDPSDNDVNPNDVERIVKILVGAGADVTIPNNNGDTPLHRIAVFDEFDADGIGIAKIFLQAGADINNQALENDFSTPLHLTVYSNYSDMLEYFVEAGADTNIKDINGDTPLHLAIAEEKYLAFNLLPLINEQTDFTIKNNNGKTVIDLLAETGKFNENGEFIYPDEIKGLLPEVEDELYQRYERNLDIYFNKNNKIDVIRRLEQRNLLPLKNTMHPSFLLKDNLLKLRLEENKDRKDSIDSKVVTNSTVGVKKFDEELFSIPTVDELGFDINQDQSTTSLFALSSTSQGSNQADLDDHRQGASSSFESLNLPTDQNQENQDVNNSDFDFDTLEDQAEQLNLY